MGKMDSFSRKYWQNGLCIGLGSFYFISLNFNLLQNFMYQRNQNKAFEFVWNVALAFLIDFLFLQKKIEF